ncbi:hypothetical protein M432DRAFT_618164 [Thermoascus aurantiacus ATCC 26904]
MVLPFFPALSLLFRNFCYFDNSLTCIYCILLCPYVSSKNVIVCMYMYGYTCLYPISFFI